MKAAYGIVRELVQTNPLLLREDYSPKLNSVIKKSLPYKVGIEIEVNPKFNESIVSQELGKLYSDNEILDYNTMYSETDLLFPAGVKGLKGLYKFCQILKEHYYFNEDSGIHLNIDLSWIDPKSWTERKKFEVVKHHYQIIQMIKNCVPDYPYAGKYNSAHSFAWNKSGTPYHYVKMVTQEFKKGEKVNIDKPGGGYSWYSYRAERSYLETTDYIITNKISDFLKGTPERIEIRVLPCIFEYTELIKITSNLSKIATYIGNL